ncbi:Crp/Fnr family transcriptional regulator [Aquimarina pacifica]|uniref:Crp/Fnr family transcriptional regulator n=1 Tax=Aquimarina pacifica TaxID=1296415 RepID=UPI000471BA1A|nr:Crp/Fnr family transcriptional regulator [Aquimarina pacifica]
MRPDLSTFISKFVSFSEKELEIINNKYCEVTIDKNDFFLREGEVCKKAAFIINGSCILSQTLNTGDVLVLDFFTEGDMISDYYSFLKNTPTDTNIKALEKTTLLIISKKDIDYLLQTIPNYQKFGRIIAEQSFIRIAEKVKRSGLSAFERYQLLIREKPIIAKKFPQYMIASYLGISPEWLSKIRAKK